MSNFSTFLFANPSFKEGMARVLDLAGTLNAYNTSQTEKQADFWALLADWHAIGQDIRGVAKEECDRLLRSEEHNADRSG